MNNSHYRCWRKYNEHIYYGNNNKAKINLILAISRNNILYYEFHGNNTNTSIFLNFMQKIAEKIKENTITKYVIILDNCTIHKSQELIELYKKEKLNILFLVPYASYFNSIELCFRALKQMIYSRLYESLDDLKKDIETFLASESIQKTIYLNFKETLEEYLYFFKNHQYENLNQYEII